VVVLGATGVFEAIPPEEVVVVAVPVVVPVAVVDDVLVVEAGVDDAASVVVFAAIGSIGAVRLAAAGVKSAAVGGVIDDAPSPASPVAKWR